MRKIKFLTLLAAVTILSAAQARATTYYTYTVNDMAGSTTITGSITTDALGPLTCADIIDWNLTIDSGSPLFQVSLFGPLTGENNSHVLVQGNDLSATPTQLLFDFADENTITPGFIQFTTLSSSPAYGVAWTSAGAGGSAMTALYAVSETDVVSFSTPRDLRDLPIAQTPLPGTLSLFGTGIVLMGLLSWRKKRKANTVTA
jgi:PEP-CTERM motif